MGAKIRHCVLLISIALLFGCFESQSGPTAYPEVTDKCGGIADTHERYECYAEFALAKQDSQICDMLGVSEAGKCRSDLDKAKTYYSICDNIGQAQLKYWCDEHVSRLSVRWDTGVSLPKPTFCDDLASPSEKDWCYYSLAVVDSDPSFCGAISDSQRKSQCYGEVN